MKRLTKAKKRKLKRAVILLSASFAIALLVFSIVFKIITDTKQADRNGREKEGLDY